MLLSEVLTERNKFSKSKWNFSLFELKIFEYASAGFIWETCYGCFIRKLNKFYGYFWLKIKSSLSAFSWLFYTDIKALTIQILIKI